MPRLLGRDLRCDDLGLGLYLGLGLDGLRRRGAVQILFRFPIRRSYDLSLGLLRARDLRHAFLRVLRLLGFARQLVSRQRPVGLGGSLLPAGSPDQRLDLLEREGGDCGGCLRLVRRRSGERRGRSGKPLHSTSLACDPKLDRGNDQKGYGLGRRDQERAQPRPSRDRGDENQEQGFDKEPRCRARRRARAIHRGQRIGIYPRRDRARIEVNARGTKRALGSRRFFLGLGRAAPTALQ